MEKKLIFVQQHGEPGIREAEIADSATRDDLEKVLKALGIEISEQANIFIDEAEDALAGDRHLPISGLKHGARVHVSHCSRIKVTVHFMDKTADRDFAPGVRVRAVKEWAVHTFKIGPKDAAEHVLQVCKTIKRPTTDTPLHELVDGKNCAVCFDLVPEKRVEG